MMPVTGIYLPSRRDVDIAIAELEITDRLEQKLVRFYWNEERRKRRAEIWRQVRWALAGAALFVVCYLIGLTIGRLR